MTKNNVIKWMEKSANTLEVLNKTLFDKAKDCILPRSLTARLTGPLKPVEVQKAFRWLQHNDKDKLEPFKTDYEKLIASAKEYDRWTDPGIVFSTFEMKLAKREFKNLRFLANALIDSLRDTAQALETGREQKIDETCTHSKDYTSVTWNSKLYKFNKSQAIAIKLLWEAYENPDKVGVHQKDIAQALDSYAKKYKLLNLFRIHGNTNPAWAEMIVHLGGGIYKLQKSSG